MDSAKESGIHAWEVSLLKSADRYRRMFFQNLRPVFGRFSQFGE